MVYYVIMENMTNDIRKAVKKQMIDKDLNQTELAQMIGKSRQQVNDVLSGRTGHLADTWQEIFDALGLELIVVSKDSSTVRTGRGE
jgi:ribosome-binding protein aMBF1 (putative translation factor)